MNKILIIIDLFGDLILRLIKSIIATLSIVHIRLTIIRIVIFIRLRLIGYLIIISHWLKSS